MDAHDAFSFFAGSLTSPSYDLSGNMADLLEVFQSFFPRCVGVRFARTRQWRSQCDVQHLDDASTIRDIHVHVPAATFSGSFFIHCANIQLGGA